VTAGIGATFLRDDPDELSGTDLQDGRPVPGTQPADPIRRLPVDLYRCLGDQAGRGRFALGDPAANMTSATLRAPSSGPLRHLRGSSPRWIVRSK